MYDAIRLGQLVEKALTVRDQADKFVQEVQWLMDNPGAPNVPGIYAVPKAQEGCINLFWRVQVKDKPYCVWKECAGCKTCPSDPEFVKEAYVVSKAIYLGDFPKELQGKINEDIPLGYEHPTGSDAEKLLKNVKLAVKHVDQWVEVLSWLAAGGAAQLYVPDYWYEIPDNDGSPRSYAYAQHPKDSKALFKVDPHESSGFDFLKSVSDLKECLLFHRGRRLGPITPAPEKTDD